jgi:uncharacterized protein (TIGR00255 family)
MQEVDKVLDDVVNARMHEGSLLELDLLDRVQIMKEEMKFIASQTERVKTERRQRVESLMAEFTVEPSLLLDVHKSHLFALLEKTDIHEEMVRFTNHVNTFETVVAQDTIEKGKQLDFILQEIGRETNTIASKCADAVISTHAINIKAQGEKAREQVQNIV